MRHQIRGHAASSRRVWPPSGHLRRHRSSPYYLSNIHSSLFLASVHLEAKRGSRLILLEALTESVTKRFCHRELRGHRENISPRRNKNTTISNHEKHESINSSRFNFVSDTKHILGFISPILGRRVVTAWQWLVFQYILHFFSRDIIFICHA